MVHLHIWLIGSETSTKHATYVISWTQTTKNRSIDPKAGHPDCVLTGKMRSYTNSRASRNRTYNVYTDNERGKA